MGEEQGPGWAKLSRAALSARWCAELANFSWPYALRDSNERGKPDWFHSNSVIYESRELRDQARLLAGAIIWILGDPSTGIPSPRCEPKRSRSRPAGFIP